MADRKKKKDDKATTADGTYVGTEDAPRTKTDNTKDDPHPDSVLGGHRYGERASTSVSGWNDPDAIPGTVGDDPEESAAAVRGGPTAGDDK